MQLWKTSTLDNPPGAVNCSRLHWFHDEAQISAGEASYVTYVEKNQPKGMLRLELLTPLNRAVSVTISGMEIKGYSYMLSLKDP